MTMVDAWIPENALRPEAEARLLKEVTDILIRAEGYEPDNQVAQSLTYLFLHRPAAVFVGGAPSESPRYRIMSSAPEGQYTDAARAALVREITEAVARAEGVTFEQVARRVWIFPTEITEGEWGAGGRINRLADIHALLVGEHDRKTAEERLARRRREQAREALAGSVDALSGAAVGEERTAEDR